ncbi:N-acetyl-gamma-glutamyl-phosphate reductase [Pseudidiomarina taiwanensis]|uniref:N-acetyl-gamma-glutamyl-phosphate reductase n=1 Tax=Pseudidiomarina taiwanensis TaxID=337250 RepID=A0A432ZG32_9GAMM|nr:N-acetyl-gamma-glutamyl-phosphate reductase [Pseudidiomarina taiwanensis]RUO76864.1 N-acetyl-gamma-glutamyl-phosphate reductase [Pseudidiomarina taiwanensis]
MHQEKSIEIPCAVWGASGYSGVELSWLLHQHPRFKLTHCFSSGAREAVPLANLYPQLQGRCEVLLEPWHAHLLDDVAKQVRVCFLALPHEVSAQLAPQLIARGLVVFDLSGAFRLTDVAEHERAYGFVRPPGIGETPYALAEYLTLSGSESLIAVPGCYPTAATLAAKPVLELKTPHSAVMVNAVSGTSGAGRAASLKTSFCEVSLQAYGVGSHRHQPEIAQNLGCDVVFVPHLGAFKRGILATVYVQVGTDVTAAMVDEAFDFAYMDSPLVRLCWQQTPALQQVVGTPYCDIGWQLVRSANSQTIVITAAIDNLLKGAASQALQVANRYFGMPDSTGLLNRSAVL